MDSGNELEMVKTKSKLEQKTLVERLLENRQILLIYEFVIAVLAFTAVLITLLDLSGEISSNSSLYIKHIDISILIIFSFDYFVRMILAKNKPLFFRKNIFDLIAIIPFNSLFRIFRMARLFRLLKFTKFLRLMKFTRLFAFTYKFTSKINKFIYTNGFIYVLYLTTATVVIGAIGIYFFEKGQTVHSFGDALWWSFVTATTVGYGDISPSTGTGRIIAVILMVIGIGFIGMLTGTISTYFLRKTNNSNADKKERILDLSDLDQRQFEEVLSFIDYIKNKTY